MSKRSRPCETDSDTLECKSTEMDATASPRPCKMQRVKGTCEQAVVEANGKVARTDATTTKREDYISWDDYFMAVAFLSSMRSKDPSTQVGACIVSPSKKIVGIGYNGFPNGCSDDKLPWARKGKTELDTKYPFVCHAEMNAIMNKNSESLKGCSIYVALFPCNECAKLIIQSGIKRVIYMSDKYSNTTMATASRMLLDMAGVEMVQFVPKQKSITISFGEP